MQMWCLAQGKLHSVVLAVPRTFYVDLTLSPDDLAALQHQQQPQGRGAQPQLLPPGAEPILRVLPNGRKAQHLYKVGVRACMCGAGVSWLAGRIVPATHALGVGGPRPGA